MNAGRQALACRQEAALIDYLERLSKRTAGRHALHLRLSALSPQNRAPQRIQIAARAFDELEHGFEGAIFHLSNNDFVIVYKIENAELVSRAVVYLKTLFAEDPIIRDAGARRVGFYRHFDLTQDLSALEKFAGQAQTAARKTHAEQARANDTANAEQAPLRSLDSKALAAIQDAIAQADLTNIIRRQPVCAVVPDQKPKPVFTEVFTSMSALQKSLTPDIDILGNRWLFQDLTAHLDRKVIAFLAHKDDTSLSKSFSINLNVESLGSKNFLALDKDMNSAERRAMIVELQLVDILADFENFTFYRAFLRGRGYRFCLDGLTCSLISLIDFRQIELDLAKIIWSPELHKRAISQDKVLLQAIEAIGPKRIVLSRCDDARVFETGKALGTSLYQGYIVDHMLKGDQARRIA